MTIYSIKKNKKKQNNNNVAMSSHRAQVKINFPGDV